MDDSVRPDLVLRVTRRTRASAARGSRRSRARYSQLLRVRVTGDNDLGLVERVELKVGNRRAGTDRRAPFSRLVRVNRSRPQTIRAIAYLDDGARKILKRTLRPRRR
jgi:hypothetical protein